jgi:hypothetical protein
MRNTGNSVHIVACRAGILAVAIAISAVGFSPTPAESGDLRPTSSYRLINVGKLHGPVHHRRTHYRTGPVTSVPIVLGEEHLSTSIRKYHDPLYSYYGGPVYYGGPYYYRPYYDGVGPTYFATHPIVEW